MMIKRSKRCVYLFEKNLALRCFHKRKDAAMQHPFQKTPQLLNPPIVLFT